MKNDLKKHLSTFLLAPSFPCVMAKAVANKGILKTHSLKDLNTSSIKQALIHLHNFVTEIQTKNNRLSSCIIIIENEKLKNFAYFEKRFWKFLKTLNSLDKKLFQPDPSVDSNPSSNNFSYSIKSESFFIIALHPNSPRYSRRFTYPAIVFNPHKQFENMRANGTYQKVRDLIRFRDKLLQGSINPMLKNFGEKSEVFQYLGKIYNDNEPLPLIF